MIVVDSSVWIDNLRGHLSDQVRALRKQDQAQILVGDVVLLEVLRGARDDLHARRIERELRQFAIIPMMDTELAIGAARNYRALRSLGITISKTVDVIIATFCIERDHLLLHGDRDFLPFERHLGLRVADL